MAYPDDITIDTADVDGGTARSLKTIEWLAGQLVPLLTSVSTKLTTIDGRVDGLEGLLDTVEAIIGATNEAAPANDTAASGLNGRTVRVLQHLSSLNTLLTTQNGLLDGVETLLGTTNTNTAAIKAAAENTTTPSPISAASLPLPTGALSKADFEARVPTLGPKAASGSVSTTPSTDQDPIFDHANAVKASVTTTSATAITPPAGAKYLRVDATADMFLRTDGTDAADAAGSIRLLANQPETIPVVAGTAVKAIVPTGTGTLYATPMKVR